jgi:hypothetical protein
MSDTPNRDVELQREFAAAEDPESPRVLKRRVDDLELRLAAAERATATNTVEG